VKRDATDGVVAGGAGARLPRALPLSVSVLMCDASSYLPCTLYGERCPRGAVTMGALCSGGCCGDRSGAALYVVGAAPRTLTALGRMLELNAGAVGGRRATGASMI
jgi:hypothetical protein